MTNRLILGVDPGQTGAVFALADGLPAGFVDMPLTPRKAGGFEISGALLARHLRALLAQHPGAYCMAVLERVHAMPQQGVSGSFRFGQADGIVRGVLGALGVGFLEVQPEKWKRHFGLTKRESEEQADKDRARGYALQRFPYLADELARKKDVGRADALLIALWAHATEQIARAA
jgi:crossover junction endodeoxyribonuclease RuvC